MILTLVDTASIQNYIFGSNRLLENIGASFLVAQATEEWAREAFDAVKQGDDRILYTGGGNATALFETRQRAEQFERRLSRRALTLAPGLQLLTVHREKRGTLPEELDRAFAHMARLKAERDHSSPLLGLGVTRNCRSTGLPAIATLTSHGNSIEVAAEVVAKVRGFHADREGKRTADLAQSCLIQALDTESLGMKTLDYDFPRDFENLGATRGEQSYIAVVHADANDMGMRIRDIGNRFRDDSGYIDELRGFSNRVKQASIAALQGTLADLIAAIRHQPGDRREIAYPKRANILTPEFAIQLRYNAGAWYLPFRPIVFGGDDVTFVCDGRLGLTLATAYLRHFERQTREHKVPLTACAGVAIVKSHYPFARAYALSEQLCRSAKSYRKALVKDHPQESISAFDWHFALSGLFGAIDQIRAREYRVSAGDLFLRPVTLGSNPDPADQERAWPKIEQAVLTFQGPEWHGKRNKLKALREVLREGPEKVREFRQLFRQADPLLQGDGWSGDRCLLYDAVELADIHLPLSGSETDSDTNGDPQ